MVGTGFVTALRHRVENAIDSKDFFSSASVSRVGVKDFARFIPVKNASARQVFNVNCPFGRGLKIVLGSAGEDVLWLERNVEVKVEIVGERGDPEGLPIHSLPDDFDLLDWRAGDHSVTDIMILKMRKNPIHVIDFERASHTLVLHARGHHEVLDVKLTASLKQV